MAERFVNEPIDVADLPQLSDDAFVAVDPRYLRVSLIGFGMTAAIFVIGGVSIASQVEERGRALLVLGGLLVLLVVGVVMRVLEVRHLAYQVRDHDVSKRSGVITRRITTVPFSRIQHVRMRRGGIERSFGLATLDVSSAGPDITIPGLDVDTASRIRELLVQRSGADDQTDDAVLGPNESRTAPPEPPAPTVAAPPTAPPPSAAPSAPPAPPPPPPSSPPEPA